MSSLTPEFFQSDPVDCARDLIGCHLGWGDCSGRIVETEAYHAIGDEACHTFMRPSTRQFVDEHKAGDAYVYLNYGVHWLFNIVVKGPEGDGFVLLRALEPVQGIKAMRQRRGNFPDKLLMAGPGRLTQAMGIGGEHHGRSFLECGLGQLEAGSASAVVSGPRIGISKATELNWRFGDSGSNCLSRKFPSVS
ncbi:3-methyladenine DNA glycosylase [Coraliomargarita sinensis]|uniref:Putative 3-methyladenine DNA glycosylase n=1 Tax=Coraliomargarita sinensis TaxID=2174842 RepID=A0A317ZM62_9BACT|nr:DNA-3-methyladenine glycosylase [Coraliomargarita sinensis]PXA05267.1 3-methyladenine DNA glycosylase [Coraliomargarita sinensis]